MIIATIWQWALATDVKTKVNLNPSYFYSRIRDFKEPSLDCKYTVHDECKEKATIYCSEINVSFSLLPALSLSLSHTHTHTHIQTHF